VSAESERSTLSSPHLWREGNVLVIERDRPLPDVCWLSGEPATRRIACLFHWSPERFAPTHGELVMVAEAIRYYVADVQKARIDVPLADDLCRKRVAGWINFTLAAVCAVATIAGLLLGQAWIDGLPKGPQRQALNTWLVPGIALGGFGLMGVFACLSYYRMPMPTARLKPTRITETHVWLSGAAPSLLARLDDSNETDWAIEEEEQEADKH
jgi:hypothetical protein